MLWSTSGHAHQPSVHHSYTLLAWDYLAAQEAEQDRKTVAFWSGYLQSLQSSSDVNARRILGVDPQNGLGPGALPESFDGQLFLKQREVSANEQMFYVQHPAALLAHAVALPEVDVSIQTIERVPFQRINQSASANDLSDAQIALLSGVVGLIYEAKTLIASDFCDTQSASRQSLCTWWKGFESLEKQLAVQLMRPLGAWQMAHTLLAARTLQNKTTPLCSSDDLACLVSIQNQQQVWSWVTGALFSSPSRFTDRLRKTRFDCLTVDRNDPSFTYPDDCSFVERMTRLTGVGIKPEQVSNRALFWGLNLSQYKDDAIWSENFSTINIAQWLDGNPSIDGYHLMGKPWFGAASFQKHLTPDLSDFAEMVGAQDSAVLSRMLSKQATPTSHAMFELNRLRVCEQSDGQLQTRDALGQSRCVGPLDVPKWASLPLVAQQMPSALDEALGGFIGFAQYDLPMNASVSGSFERVDRQEPWQVAACEADEILCDLVVSSLSEQSSQAAKDAMALKSFGQSLHAVQEMTLPHRLMPTLGWGLSAYEQFAGQYLIAQAQPNWVALDDAALSDEQKMRVCLCSQSTCSAQCDGRTGMKPATITSAKPSAWKKVASQNSMQGKYALMQSEIVRSPENPCASQMMWDAPCFSFAVNEEREALRTLMSTLTTEAQNACDGLSARRLTLATALRMSAIVRRESEGLPLIEGLATDAPSVLKFLLHSAAISGHPIEAPLVKGSTVWQRIAHQSAPVMVASTALMMELAVLARTTPESLCDGKDNVVPWSTPLELKSNTQARQCVVQTQQLISECLAWQSNGRTDLEAVCRPYSSLDAYDECNGPHERWFNHRCGRLPMEIASCACAHTGDDAALFEGGFNWTAKQKTDVEDCLVQSDLRHQVAQWLKQGQIEAWTAHHLLNDGNLPDDDKDGVPNVVDRCPDESPPSSMQKLNEHVCKRNDIRCAFGCVRKGGQP